LKLPDLPGTVAKLVLCRYAADEHPEMAMKLSWFAIAVAIVALTVTASDPAAARARHKARPRCVDQPYAFSVYGLILNPRPQPNGCAPPVYAYGEYVGQDPDPNIRLNLMRDPQSGYAGDLAQ
jgi:hypothetical protein